MNQTFLTPEPQMYPPKQWNCRDSDMTGQDEAETSGLLKKFLKCFCSVRIGNLEPKCYALQIQAPFQRKNRALMVKNPPASAGDVRDVSSIPGSGRSPGGGHDTPL